MLSPCALDSTPDKNFSACIDSVQYRKLGTSNWNAATLSKVQLGQPTETITKPGSRYPVDVSPIAFDQKQFIPPGDKATIWSMSGSKHSSGEDYLVRARFIGNANQINTADGGLIMDFLIELLPIAYPVNTKTITQDLMRVQEFPQDFEYRVRLKTGVFVKAITGWFFGRMTSPMIDRNGPLGYLDIAGTPAKVPIGITDKLPTSDANKLINLAIQCKLDQDGISMCLHPIENKAGLLTSIDSPPEVLNTFESASGGVKTAASLSYWSLDSRIFASSDSEIKPIQDCTSSLYGQGARVFQGAVFSNATLFQTSTPQWNQANQSLSFKVASPHLDEKGIPNKGFYTLYIPQEIAKCLWGDSINSPLAEVQIDSSDGKSAITTIANKVENGMLRFNISGFGYSSPTIKIRLASNIKEIKASVPEIASIPVRTKTISCIKGKTVKKVSGASPKCPTGYKIKS